MSFRAKCPSCGRKQSAQLSEVGKVIFCAACGTRFLVERMELVDDSATIPDIDFFPAVVPIPDPAPSLPLPPAVPAVLPPDAPAPQPALDIPAEFQRPEISPAAPSHTSHQNLVILLAIAGGVIVLLVLALGITVGYMLSRPDKPLAPVSVEPTSQPPTPAEPKATLPETRVPVSVISPAPAIQPPPMKPASEAVEKPPTVIIPQAVAPALNRMHLLRSLPKLPQNFSPFALLPMVRSLMIESASR